MEKMISVAVYEDNTKLRELLDLLINSTPGTVWVEILPEGHQLVLHVFDLHDEQWWIDTIKQRYERPLIEVFEGGFKS